MAAKKSKSNGSESVTIAQNRRARYDYEIQDTIEAGIVLAGTEVKALRSGRANLQESYAGEIDGELFLINAYIPEYTNANRFNHETKRPRKLLVKRNERDRLLGSIRRKGMTLVPMSLFFNRRGLVKLSLGLGLGKKHHDKRETEKQRDWSRDRQRLLRERG